MPPLKQSEPRTDNSEQPGKRWSHYHFVKKSEAKRKARDQMVGERTEAERTTGDAQAVEVGVGKLVFDKQRPMSGKGEVCSRKDLHPRTVPLILLEMGSGDR